MVEDKRSVLATLSGILASLAFIGFFFVNIVSYVIAGLGLILGSVGWLLHRKKNQSMAKENLKAALYNVGVMLVITLIIYLLFLGYTR